MRRIRIVGTLAVVTVLSALMAGSAHAQGTTSADCTIIFSMRFHPGVTLVPSSGPQDTGGETGSITCTGTIDGSRITGPGTFGVEGMHTQINCLLDGAPFAGTYSFTIPTETGLLHRTGKSTDSRIGLADVITAWLPGARFVGAALLVPTDGTCAVTPLNVVQVYLVGSFRPEAVGSPGAPAPTVTGPPAGIPTDVLGSNVRRPRALPVTGPAHLGLLAVLIVACYTLGGIALARARKQARPR